MNDNTEQSDCQTLSEAWDLARLYDNAAWMAAYDSIRDDLAAIAAGATVH